MNENAVNLEAAYNLYQRGTDGNHNRKSIFSLNHKKKLGEEKFYF